MGFEFKDHKYADDDQDTGDDLELRYLLLLIKGSSTAVNKVSEEKHTRATDTVDNLIDKKNNIQCAPTSAPVNTS